jgi:hypothetical protein
MPTQYRARNSFYSEGGKHYNIGELIAPDEYHNLGTKDQGYFDTQNGVGPSAAVQADQSTPGVVTAQLDNADVNKETSDMVNTIIGPLLQASNKFSASIQKATAEFHDTCLETAARIVEMQAKK